MNQICETCVYSLECEYQDAASFCPKYDKRTEPASQGGLMGWICPKCGAVMSPFQPCCVKCSNNFEITYSSTGTPLPQTYCTLESNEDYNIALLG